MSTAIIVLGIALILLFIALLIVLYTAVFGLSERCAVCGRPIDKENDLETGTGSFVCNKCYQGKNGANGQV